MNTVRDWLFYGIGGAIKMANEKRLIDASAFAEALENGDTDVCETYLDCYCECGFSRKAIEDIVDRIPTVDAVEVVRCKDCKHYIDGRCYIANRKPQFSYKMPLHICQADDFCSHGERREGE